MCRPVDRTHRRSVNALRILPRSLPGLVFGLLILTAPSVALGWPRPTLELSAVGASSSFTPLADYTRFVEGPDRPLDVRAEYDATEWVGFALGWRIHPALALDWTRVWGTSRYRWFQDDRESREGLVDGIEVSLPEIDLRMDLVSLRARPARWTWKGVGPVARAGAAFVLQSPQGVLRPPRNLALDWGDADRGVDLGLGLEGRWRSVHAALELRSVHWRFQTDDDRVPREWVHAWMPGARLGVAF